MARSPLDDLASKAASPNGEPSGAVAVADSPLPKARQAPVDPPLDPTGRPAAKRSDDDDLPARGGPTSRPARADPRPRHQLRPISEMPEAGGESLIGHIPKSEYPDQFDLQWVTDSVLGQPVPGHRMEYEKMGWQSVHQEDFENKYRGWFLPPDHEGEIKRDGMVLMARPMEWSNVSRARAHRDAQRAVAVKQAQLGEGNIPGVAGADHISAKKFNHLHKTAAPLDVPREGTRGDEVTNYLGGRR